MSAKPTHAGGDTHPSLVPFLSHHPFLFLLYVPQEVVDIIVANVEKYPSDYEKAASLIQESLNKKFGSSWHVVSVV